MNSIVDIMPYSEKSARVRIENSTIATKALPGNFVVVKFSEEGQRIPFAIINTDPELGIFDIIIHRAAGLDEILSSIDVGMTLPDVLGPLGNPAELPHDKSLLFCGDGAGFVPLLPLIKEAKRRGCKVAAFLSEYSSQTKCLIKEVEEDCDEIIRPDDHEYTERLAEVIDSHKIDKVLVAGPTMLMKGVAEYTRQRGIPADCLLNMLMIDGIGLCGVCRVIVDGKRKQTCIDGPIFDAHLVDFDQMINRQRLFV